MSRPPSPVASEQRDEDKAPGRDEVLVFYWVFRTGYIVSRQCLSSHGSRAARACGISRVYRTDHLKFCQARARMFWRFVVAPQPCGMPVPALTEAIGDCYEPA